MKEFFRSVLFGGTVFLICFLITACGQNREVYATYDDIYTFLTGLGWEVGDVLLEQAEVTIPTEFDDVYTVYNTMQKETGCNLEEYCGKTVTRYTYEILNHPKAQGRQVRVNLLVFDEKIIGGDIMVTALDGFMHGLCRYPGM